MFIDYSDLRKLILYPGNSVGNTCPDETALTVSVSPGLIDVTSLLEVTGKTQGLTPSKRTRGKSVSISTSAVAPAHLLRSPSITPAVSGTSDKILNNLAGDISLHRSEPPASVPPFRTLASPSSPVSPHSAKQRKGVFGEFSSGSSETTSVNSTSNLGGDSGDRICISRALHHHPMLDNEHGVGSSLLGTGSPKTKSDHAVAETESTTGSTITEPGSSARSDSISDSSNSDIEIYLETHGFNDSAIRMNCVGQQSFTGV